MKMKARKRLWKFLKENARGYTERWVDYDKSYSETPYLRCMIEEISDSFIGGESSIELSGYDSKDGIARDFDFDETDFPKNYRSEALNR